MEGGLFLGPLLLCQHTLDENVKRTPTYSFVALCLLMYNSGQLHLTIASLAVTKYAYDNVSWNSMAGR